MAYPFTERSGYIWALSEVGSSGHEDNSSDGEGEDLTAGRGPGGYIFGNVDGESSERESEEEEEAGSEDDGFIDDDVVIADGSDDDLPTDDASAQSSSPDVRRKKQSGKRVKDKGGRMKKKHEGEVIDLPSTDEEEQSGDESESGSDTPFREFSAGLCTSPVWL